MMKDNEKKTTSEKPLSLSPLKFVEVLAGLLNVKPKSEREENQEKGGKSKDNK